MRGDETRTVITYTAQAPRRSRRFKIPIRINTDPMVGDPAPEVDGKAPKDDEKIDPGPVGHEPPDELVEVEPTTDEPPA